MMSRVDRLIRRYERFVDLPWERRLAGVQRVWFIVHDKTDDRRMRARIDEFAIATTRAADGWNVCDLTDSFPRWMAAQDYPESYFEAPESLEILLPEFHEHVVELVRAALEADDVGPDTWKPIEEQPLGWDPDINDCVRINIRPFMLVDDVGKRGAGVLRDTPNIKWGKNRGKDPADAPWYDLFGGERINDHHLRLAEKRAARGVAGGAA